MSINPAYLGAGLRHAYAFGPLAPEEGLFAISCFGDAAFCSESICIALANSPTLDLAVPIPSPTDILEDDPISSISASRCLWRVSDNSPSVPQQLIWGLAETKLYRTLCPRLCVVTFLGESRTRRLYLLQYTCIPFSLARPSHLVFLHIIFDTECQIFTLCMSLHSPINLCILQYPV